MNPITVVRRVEARLVPFRWTWAEKNRTAIAANWERRRAATPAIFNGRVLMVCGLEHEGEVLRASFFATDYANMLAHIDGGFRDPQVENGFAMGALRSSDRAFILGEMAADTANAGRLYFAAGTPDMTDVDADGNVDLESSILRELEEETGLGSELVQMAPEWVVVRFERRVAFMRELDLAVDAATALAAIRAYLDGEDKPELSGVTALRHPDEIEEARMPSFLPLYLRWAFEGA